jgi:tRNA A-37 threonylcarbamoyl transferase component Bud32
LSSANQDCNLLFGIVALQFDFVTRDQLVAAMNAWVLDKKRSLADLLVERGALTASRRVKLDAMVEEHLLQHQGDTQRSLAAFGTGEGVQALEEIQDIEVESILQTIYRDASHAKGPHDPPGAQAALTDNSTIAPPATHSSRFRILRQHAKGGLGVVYIAHDQEVNRQVALKEIQGQHADRADSRARFLLEAEITGALEHPGIVPVYGLGRNPDGRPYYAMRFIKGDSLKRAIAAFHAADDAPRDATERNLSQRQLLRRFVDVCNAIDYAHSKGVLHRDLKPENIMLGKFGETLVVDWGLAKVTGKTDASTVADLHEVPLTPTSDGSAPTQMGSALGTPAYMSPEQAVGRLDLLCAASDVYSLGATLYCILTGKPPFQSVDIAETLVSVQKGEFKRPRQVKASIDTPLEAICLKAMALDPKDRYESAAALRKDVESWIADAPVGAWPEPLTVKTRRWLAQHRVLATTTVVGLLVALGFLGVLAAVKSDANSKLGKLAL